MESTTDDNCSQPTPFKSQLSSEWQDSQEHEDSPLRKRKALNTFLDAIGVSPIKKTLTVDFESASKRTQNDYLKNQNISFTTSFLSSLLTKRLCYKRLFIQVIQTAKTQALWNLFQKLILA